MLVVFSPIFVADTKIIFRYDFVAPLRNLCRQISLIFLGSEKNSPTLSQKTELFQ